MIFHVPNVVVSTFLSFWRLGVISSERGEEVGMMRRMMWILMMLVRDVWMEEDMPSVYGNLMDVKISVEEDYDVALKEAIRSRTPLILKDFGRRRLK